MRAGIPSAGRAALAATTAAAALVVALAGCGKAGGLEREAQPAETTRVETTRVELVERPAQAQADIDPEQVYRLTAPGVVTVISLFRDEDDEDAASGRGLGSGFVVTPDGEVVTNAHVVTDGEGEDLERAREVYVEFDDFNRVRAEIVGVDPNADIALLRVDPAGLRLRPLTLGTSADLDVGEPVIAIGSPFGERQSLSIGIVSGLDRTIDSLTGFSISNAIQTDAAINRGNSGGPLLDTSAKVVGVNSQIRTTGGGSEGVGFAVSVDVVKRALDQLREDGEAEYGFLGVATTRVFPQLADRFDLPVSRGALIQEVTNDSPAQRAGLRAGSREERFQVQPYLIGGDIIVGVDGQEIRDETDLAETISMHRPGDRVDVEYFRDGERRTVAVELAARPS